MKEKHISRHPPKRSGEFIKVDQETQGEYQLKTEPTEKTVISPKEYIALIRVSVFAKHKLHGDDVTLSNEESVVCERMAEPKSKEYHALEKKGLAVYIDGWELTEKGKRFLTK